MIIPVVVVVKWNVSKGIFEKLGLHVDGLEEHEVGEDVLDEAEVRHRDVEVGPWNIGQLRQGWPHQPLALSQTLVMQVRIAQGYGFVDCYGESKPRGYGLDSRISFFTN